MEFIMRFSLIIIVCSAFLAGDLEFETKEVD